MVKGFRRVLSVAVVLVFTGIVFAGCSLFTRDVKYYNNLPVAQVGNDITVTKKELMDAYNSWGYQYVGSFGYTLDKAYETTLDMLIDREITAKLSANIFGFGDAQEGQMKYVDISSPTKEKRVAATEYEAAQARKKSFETIESSLRGLEERIREERKWPDRADNKSSSSTLPVKEDVYTPYEKYLIRQGNSYRINLARYRELPANEHTFESNDKFLDYLEMARDGSRIIEGVANSFELTIANDAFERLVRFLANNEKGLGYKYNTTAQKRDTVKRELERMQRQEEKNLLAKRIEDCFDQGILDFDFEIDGVSTNYDQITNLRQTNFVAYEAALSKKNQTFADDLARKAQAEYRSKVRTAVDRYNRKLDTEESYKSKLLDGLNGTHFVPSNVANQFFTVSHILLEYSEQQKTELSKIEERYKQDKNEANRANAMQVLKDQVRVTRRADGVATGNPMSAQEVLTYVQSYVAPHSRNKSLDRKVQDFRDCIYMFNSDPGMKNPEYEYVIGADLRKDQSAKSTEDDTMSKMVPEFTKASRDLFNFNKDENRGGVMRVQEYVRQFEVSSNTFGHYELVKDELVDTRGTMSGLVWTDYGAHIIMYTRNISDFIFTNTMEMIETSADFYLNAPLASYGNKTTFDVLVEGIQKPSYSRYEQQRITEYKEDQKITYHKKNYKDLTKAK